MDQKINDYNHMLEFMLLKETLIEFSKMERSNLEKRKNLECLRIIENSKKLE